MTGALALSADIVGQIGWHAWQASVTGIPALALAMLLRRRAPRAAALMVALALLKFVMPPVVRFPFAFGDTFAVLLNPFGLVPNAGHAASGNALTLAGIAFGWILVAGLFALGIVRHASRVRRVRLSARTVTCGPLIDAMARASAALRPRRPAVLLLSDEAEGPFATGVLHPAVVLPQRLADRLHPDALAIVIGHELAHHRRRDLPVAWCTAAATTLFWFSPVVWLLARMLRELREICCDADVVRSGIAGRAAYVEALVAAARVTAGASALPMRDRHPLTRRLRQVLEPSHPIPAALAVGVVLLFALLCTPSSPFKPLWSRDDGVQVRRNVDVNVQETVERPFPATERMVRERP